MAQRIRALSLHRPWASLILVDHPRAKRTENRSWLPNYTGWFLLHNSKAWDPTAETLALRLGLHHLISWHPEDHPAGIVGAAYLVHCCSDGLTGIRCHCDEWAAQGQRHWHLGRKAYALDEVIPCSGRQCWWYPPEDIAAAVSAQLTKTAGA